MSLQLFKNASDVEEFKIDLESVRDAYSEILEAQKEVGGMVTYRAKVATGGGKAFDIITGDEDSDTSLPTFSGVIVFNHNCNAYFDEDSSGNNPPICSSMDGITGIDTEYGECFNCKICSRNVYGTAKNGRGKACKNMHRLYIMTEGSPVPLMLSLPPTSLKSFQNYRLSTLAAKRLKPCEVVTEFSLTPQQSQSGQKYSVVKFKLLGKLPDGSAKIAQYFAEQMKAAASKIPEISADDYNRVGTASENADDTVEK
ncbi:MAG: hypothetical protein HFE63_10835 [Clostridiales bacterium]|nr:hypothetical protein [Clostridiales bacterium]